MPNHLATYLKDHDAGSEAALQILDHIEASHGDGAAGQMARTLRPQFLEERRHLQSLLEKLDDSTSVSRRVAGWLSEKAVRLKLAADDPADGVLRLLEAVELLGLGVYGKLGLWKALAANRAIVPALAAVPLERLILQADSQRALIESVRLEAAQHVIGESA